MTVLLRGLVQPKYVREPPVLQVPQIYFLFVCRSNRLCVGRALMKLTLSCFNEAEAVSHQPDETVSGASNN